MAIITAISPTRISFVGGGTDTSPFCDVYGGATVSLAINIRQHFTLYTYDDMWLVKNQVPLNCKPEFIYAFRDRFGVSSMHHNRFVSESDGGINSGIGSSAAIAVTIIGALAKSQNKTMSRSEIAELAWDIEVNDLGMFGGKQDQYSAAYGGLNLFEFTNLGVTVQPFDKKYVDKIMPYLVLMHTNLERKDPKIQEGFKKLDSKQIKALKEIKSLVAPAIKAIGDSDIQALGEILDISWNFKKQSNKGITNLRISDIYQTAKKHGAIGGKITGAGGGGFMVFIVKDKEKFIKEMKDLEYWDISCDWNGLEVKQLTQ